MSPGLASLDGVAAGAVVVAAAAYLGARLVRSLRGTRGGCACPSAGACGPKGPSAAELAAAAARGAARVNRGTGSIAR